MTNSSGERNAALTPSWRRFVRAGPAAASCGPPEKAVASAAIDRAKGLRKLRIPPPAPSQTAVGVLVPNSRAPVLQSEPTVLACMPSLRSRQRWRRAIGDDTDGLREARVFVAAHGSPFADPSARPEKPRRPATTVRRREKATKRP